MHQSMFKSLGQPFCVTATNIIALHDLYICCHPFLNQLLDLLFVAMQNFMLPKEAFPMGGGWSHVFSYDELNPHTLFLSMGRDWNYNIALSNMWTM